ncbi:WD40 repeat-like protein [Clavulina sp. PMI_390]|nr:WD40 repeat-like protein [Clavulina sp. PMI_390]
MDFQPTIVKKHARITKSHTPEARYWRRFKYPVFIKDIYPITSVHFSPAAPHRYAVTSGVHVQIYSPKTQKIYKSISRFKTTAASGNIRHDGKLVAAGDASGLIQIFDINSRAILRTLDEHKLPVHVTKFSAGNTTQLLSCSDDFTVRLWDIPSQTSINTFADHDDYVRSGHIMPSNPSLLLTGSYDSTVRLWDARTGSCTMTMSCMATSPSTNSSGEKTLVGERVPVYDVLPFASGTMALSASGPSGVIRLWDLVAGGKCVRAMSNHQKAVTTLAFDGSGSRVLSGGLDHMVKVYDVSTYKVVHTMRYPAPVLCVAVSPDDTHIAAGMGDGTFSIRRRQPKASEDAAAAARAPKKDAFQALLDGDTMASLTKTPVLGSKAKGKQRAVQGDANELTVESKRRKKLKDYDKMLKTFRYSAALDSVLKKSVPPTTAFSLITELVHQDALRSALSGRDDVLLEPILHLLVQYVSDPRFGELVCDVAIVLLDMYASAVGQSPIIDSLFIELRKRVHKELIFQRELVSIKGALEMILSANSMGHSGVRNTSTTPAVVTAPV